MKQGVSSSLRNMHVVRICRSEGDVKLRRAPDFLDVQVRHARIIQQLIRLLETKPAKLMSIWLAHQGTGVHVLSLRAVRKWQRRGKASVFSRKDVDDLQCLGLSALAVSAEVPPLSLLFDSPVLAVPALIPAPMLFVLGGTPSPSSRFIDLFSGATVVSAHYT